MYEDGSLVAKFSTFVLVGLSRRCMVRSSLGFGWVGFVLFFFFVWLGPLSSDMENWFECKGVGVAPRGWIGGRRAVNHGARGEARRSVPSASATREGEDEDVVGIVA